jgi:SAM-dependent methyltransferase
MIIHKLIAQHLSHRDNEDFYQMQAADAIRWLKGKGVRLGPEVRALDLGCGHGIFGAELLKQGCDTTFADEQNLLLPEIRGARFLEFNIDREDLKKLGQYDLVICSNVLEHLSKPMPFLESIQNLLSPRGQFYLSWTNWLSPWGGHEFSPFHYLGPKTGVRIFDSVVRKPRFHTPFVNLFPTTIGAVLRKIRNNPAVEIQSMAPRYYPELALIMRLPLIREFLTWNSALLLRRR